MLILAPLALIIDYAAGYPDWLYRRIRHPVVWAGALIGRLDRAWNREELAASPRRLRGVAMLLGLALLAATGGWLVAKIGWIAELLAAASLLAGRSLYVHVEAVRAAPTLEAARAALARIVGRDVATLDEAGVCRAAVESLAENSSDGLVAPLFWYLIAGLPGMAVYKAVSTADSMVGYRTPRHLAFGWCAARMDDALNYLPARLTALLYALAARSARAWRIALRDARKHASPNAGWPEAAMAGALGVTLGGPSMRGGVWQEGPAFGEGSGALTRADIGLALALYRRLCVILLLLTLGIAALALIPATYR